MPPRMPRLRRAHRSEVSFAKASVYMRCAALHARRHARMGAQHGREGAGPGQPRAPLESMLLSLQTAITKCRRNRVASSGVARSASHCWLQSRESLDAVNRPCLSSNLMHPSSLRGEGSARSGTLGRLSPGKPNLEEPNWRLPRIWRTSQRRRSHKGKSSGMFASTASEPRRTPLHRAPFTAVRTTREGETIVAAGGRQAAGEKQTRAFRVRLAVGRRVMFHLTMPRVALLGVRSFPSISDFTACTRRRPSARPLPCTAPHALYSPARSSLQRTYHV